MVSQNVERALQDVKALSPDERQQLLAMLETERRVPLATAEDRAEAALLAKGIIARIPPPGTPADVAHHHAVVPVAVDGPPVSESLIEDRR